MSAATGAFVGLVAGVGILVAVSGVLASRRPRLADRIAPRSGATVLPSAGPMSALWEICRPMVASVSRILDRDFSRGESLGRRLRQAGRPDDLARYRLEQSVWAGSGAIAGLLLFLAVVARGQEPSPVLALLMTGLLAGGALLVHSRRLSGEIRKRGRRMSAQLPTVAELLAFAVSAGESPLAALDRVSGLVIGELAQDLQHLVATVRGGTPFLSALRALSDDSPSPDVARFVDGIAVATERGTPMADVLRSQAADARAAGRRSLLESAGRKEILMLVPVVFFILPIVVVIALFPGIHGLQLTVH